MVAAEVTRRPGTDRAKDPPPNVGGYVLWFLCASLALWLLFVKRPNPHPPSPRLRRTGPNHLPPGEGSVSRAAASCWLDLDGNPVHIAEQFERSVDQLKTHKKALVTRADAERFLGGSYRDAKQGSGA